jgi:hypothetical protein
MATKVRLGCYMRGGEATNFVENNILERKRKSA